MKRKPNRVTSHVVAKLAGVSQPTVSRAFTPSASIAKDKRDRVLAAAKQLNYLPNSIASSLSKAHSNIVAVIVGDMNNPFYAESLEVFINRLQATGRQVLVFSVADGRDCDDVLMRALRYHVDGVVVTSAHLSSDLVSLSQGVGIPITLFNRSTADHALNAVLCNSITGSEILAQTMHDAGARRYLIVRGDPQGSTSRNRVKGFRDKLESLAVLSDAVEEIDGDSSYSGAFDTISERFADEGIQRPDAIFAVNDIMAMGCADALRDVFKLRIPEDVMLAGFDGIRPGQLAAYQLTTIRQPIEEMVEKTLELLDQTSMSDEDGEKDQITQTDHLLAGTFVPGKTVPSTNT